MYNVHVHVYIVHSCIFVSSVITCIYTCTSCSELNCGNMCGVHYPTSSPSQEPAKVGFRAVIVSPTRELAQQTYRECTRLCVGSGFRVHVLTKAKATANSFGPSSSQRFGMQHRYIATACILPHTTSLYSGNLSNPDRRKCPD